MGQRTLVPGDRDSLWEEENWRWMVAMVAMKAMMAMMAMVAVVAMVAMMAMVAQQREGTSWD